MKLTADCVEGWLGWIAVERGSLSLSLSQAPSKQKNCAASSLLELRITRSQFYCKTHS
jgi:hypothetical protein